MNSNVRYQHSKLSSIHSPVNGNDVARLSLLCLAFCKLLTLLGLSAIPQVVWADEVILERSNSDAHIIGDFTLSSPSPSRVHGLQLHCLGCDEEDSGVYSISAGELWTFFKEQGIESTDRLTLLIDLDRSKVVGDPRMNSVNLRLQDGSGSITLANLGADNRFVIKTSDVIRFRPEAQLELGLGFDFMQRFTADSQERIVLTSLIEGIPPESARISVQGKRRAYNLPTIYSLVAFVVFWGVMFLVLRRSTRSREDQRPKTPKLQTNKPELILEPNSPKTSSVA
jgi:hypothetical protein